MPRFAILEHTGAPDDLAGRHFDLLLEDGESCRTWRLATLPEPGGQPVAASELPPHRLAWLDHEAGEVSGGRGYARRIAGGRCRFLTGDRAAGSDPSEIVVEGVLAGWRLRLVPSPGGWVAVADG